MICDIIIPVWNQYDFTKDCIASVFNKTVYPFRLIIIDNASNQPTKSYLERLAQDKKDNIILLRNETNLGFIKAVNQGIRHSKAAYLCLLNNDTEVARGWLTEMQKVAQLKEDIGIINPNSNTLGHKIKKAKSLDGIAGELKSFSGEYSELAWASGFCMLIKREVIQKVGLFDEVFGMGTFEDADFSKRAQRLGFLSVCARAAFVYHRERSSFRKFKTFDKNFDHNRRIFHARWGRQKRLLYIFSENNFFWTEKINKDILDLARQGEIIWIFLKGKDRHRPIKGFNTSVYNLPRHFFKLACLWRVLKRKKKFDRIYADNEDLVKLLNNFKPLHKAEIRYQKI